MKGKQKHLSQNSVSFKKFVLLGHVNIVPFYSLPALFGDLAYKTLEKLKDLYG